MVEYQTMLYEGITKSRATPDLILPRVLRRQTPDSREPESEPPVPKRKSNLSTGAEVSPKSIDTQAENNAQGTAGETLDLDMEMFGLCHDNHAEVVIRFVYVLIFSRAMRLSRKLMPITRVSFMIIMSMEARLSLKSLIIST
jgi:hypothetical protein